MRPALFAALVAFVVLLLVRGFIERSVLQTTLAQATGATVAVGAIHEGLTGFDADAIHLESAGGSVLDVPRAQIRFTPFSIALSSPRATLALGGLANEAHERLAGALERLRGMQTLLKIDDGTLTISSKTDDGDATLLVQNINGSVAFERPAAYTLSANLIDGARSFPISGQTSVSQGQPAWRWNAAAVPIAPLVALHPSPAIAVTSGLARDLNVRFDGALHASANLSDIEGTFAGHALKGVHGPISLAATHAGSSGISGTFDGIPLSLRGEAYDLNDPLLALRDGTRDLRGVLRLLSMIATQPNLQFVRLETTAPGVAFAQYAVSTPIGPHVVHLVLADPAEPTVRIGTAIAGDHVISHGERTSDLAVRTHAIAGVNGDYFDIGRSYEPQGILIRDGVMVRGPTDRAALIIDRDKKPTFAEFQLSGLAKLNGRFFPITQFNSWPLNDTTIVTPDYGTTLPSAPGASFARLAPIDEAKHRYRITAVEAADHPLPVSFGVAFGPRDGGAHPRVGDVVELDYALSPDVHNAVAAIGGGPILLKNGEWYEDPHAPAPDERDVRWPVVALGVLADGQLLLSAVDGRHPERSVGMTRPEFADLLRSFGVTDAMALDSGGSVTLVSRAPGDTAASVRNVPSDDSAERYISDALLLFSTAPANTIVTAPSPAASASPAPLATP